MRKYGELRSETYRAGLEKQEKMKKPTTFSVADAVVLVNKIIGRIGNSGPVLDEFFQLIHNYQNGLVSIKHIHSRFCLLFHAHPDLLEELSRLIMGAEQQQEKRVCAVSAATAGLKKRVRDKRKKGGEIQGTKTADFQSSHYREGIKLFNKVRQRLCGFDEYGQFLELVHMYCKGQINGSELETMMAELLPMDDDLVKEVVEFKRLCQRNTDHGMVACGASNGFQELDEELEKKRRRKVKYQEQKKKEGGDNQRAKVTVTKIERCTPSYRPRKLDEFPVVHVANTNNKAPPILNDDWVCEPCPGTGFSNKPKKMSASEAAKNDYEDERYVLDWALESLKSTIANAEKLQSHINQGIGTDFLELNVATPIHLEDHFTTLNMKHIKLIYGERYGLRVKERLCKNPSVFLPIVLARLKQKKEEVSESIRALGVIRRLDDRDRQVFS